MKTLFVLAKIQKNERQAASIALQSAIIYRSRKTAQKIKTEKVRLMYKQAWAAYDAAQMNELNLFDDLLKDLVQAIDEHAYDFGRPIHESGGCGILLRTENLLATFKQKVSFLIWPCS